MTHADLNRALAIDIATAELSQWSFADPYGVLDMSLENFGTEVFDKRNLLSSYCVGFPKSLFKEPVSGSKNSATRTFELSGLAREKARRT